MRKAILALLALIMVSGCSQQTEPIAPSPDRTLTVYTTIAPIHFAVRELLGDRDTVINTTSVGEDAAHYMPDRDVLSEMVEADLIILNGAGFEEWSDSVTLPDSITLDSAHAFRNEWIAYEKVVHSHGDHEHHSHEGYNGHTWMAPAYFQQQVETIYERLKTMLTEEQQQARNLSENYLALNTQLSGLDAKARAVLTPLQGTTIAATHPTYDYLGQSYDFEVFNIDIDPTAEEVTSHIDGELHKLSHEQAHTAIAYLFWEEEPSEALQQATAEMGITNIVFPPLEDMDDPDYISGMEDTLSEIAHIISAD